MTPENLQTDDALRPIDSALAEFLGRQFPDASAAQCQLAALVSRQLGDGHLCLPIKMLEEHAAAHGLPQASSAELLRSEEHTSELQSRGHLVCRLLLEKQT